MNIFKRILVWASGHSASGRDMHPDDINSLAKVGSKVVLSMLVASAGWFLAAFSMSNDLPLLVRVGAGAGAAAIGAAVVGVVDRSLIFSIDTRSGKVGWRLRSFVIFRVMLVLAIGSFTSLSVLPAIMAPELELEALHMGEVSEQSRVAALEAQYQIDNKRQAAASASISVSDLRREQATIPKLIQRDLNVAANCWRDYGRRKQDMLGAGDDEAQVRIVLGGRAAACARAADEANKELKQFNARMEAEVEHALVVRLARDEALTKSTSEIDTKTKDAHAIEADALNIRNPKVMWSLITTHPAALMKWVILNLVIVGLELIAVFSVLTSPQSPVGHRIARDREVRVAKIDAEAAAEQSRTAELHHEAEMRMVLTDSAMQGMRQAARSPEVQRAFADNMTAYFAALGPAEAVGAVLRELVALQKENQALADRWPHLASIISSAWSSALAQVAELMSRMTPIRE